MLRKGCLVDVNLDRPQDEFRGRCRCNSTALWFGLDRPLNLTEVRRVFEMEYCVRCALFVAA